MPDPIDAYKVLQVDPEAETEVIQAAYRRLARKYHPDLAVAPEAALRMAAINEAWKLIGKPSDREAYDRLRSAGTPDVRRAPPVPDPAAGTGQARPAPAARPAASRPPPETVSRDWTSGRSDEGGGFDTSMRRADGLGAAGPPPGNPSGTVLNFGRYNGWSLGEVARLDIEYIEWLDRTPIGRNYREELDVILRASGRRRSEASEGPDRRGLFRRR
jgi:curved DNA-binding protein CbpA